MNYLNRTAIVIQGPSLYVKEIKSIWKDYKDNIIFSTWKGSENLYDYNDIVIFNDEPKQPGPYNFNFQKISTYNGLLKSKELGFDYVLKIRSDYFPTNPEKFFNLIDFNKINILMWHYTSFLWKEYPSLNGYFTDHFMFGPIDNMIELWNIDTNFCSSPEIILTWNYINKLKNKIELNFLIHKIDNNNNLFYAKENNRTNHNLGHNSTLNVDGRNIYGRYDNVYQHLKDYTKYPNDIIKYFKNYLNFLNYFVYLPEITVIGNCNIDLVYPKIKYSDNIENVNTEYFIYAEDLKTKYDLFLYYFNEKDIYYINPIDYLEKSGNNKLNKLKTKYD